MTTARDPLYGLKIGGVAEVLVGDEKVRGEVGKGSAGIGRQCNLMRHGHGYPFNGHEYINNK